MTAELNRSIRLPHATALVVGTIVGASIFVQASEMTQHLPDIPAVIAAWIVSGVLTLFGALACAELASAFPRTGSIYVFLRETYAPVLGFLWGWAMFWMMHSGIIAAMAVVFARHVAVFVPMGDRGIRVAAVLAIFVIPAINYAGVRIGSTVQAVITAGKLLAVALVVSVGFVIGSRLPVHFSYGATTGAASVTPQGFLLALVAGLFAFGGWHLVTNTAGETVDPQRTILRALIIGIIIVTACYVALNGVYFYVLPLDRVTASSRVAADAATVVLSKRGGALVAGLVILSVFGTMSGSILAAPRVYFAMAQDGYWSANPGLTDLDIRFRVMDRHPDVRQILTIAGPNIESITRPEDSVECARIANDEMPELAAKFPGRFVTACACLPMNNVDEALAEIDRAIGPLGFHGVEVFTDVNGTPLDAPQFIPVFEKMLAYDLPILLHPRRTNTRPDYPKEERSRFLVYTNFGWPFESSAAMARLAFGGVLERFPKLKIITHHAGGMIPFFHKRIQLAWDFNVERMGYNRDGMTLTREPLEYYRMFYCDTAIQGNTPALMCAWEFFGPDHMVFATDTRYDNELGERVYRETIPAVQAMPVSEAQRRMIFEDNARRLFRL